MSNSKQKVLQYLDEAHATEQALVRVLQSQIAMTPRGSYRTALETHLRETRDHADRVAKRRRELGGGSGPLGSVVGFAETLVGQALALGKTPIDMVRGTGGEEKILKNAKDASATEASLERLARVVGDTETADLAASIRADEEKMLERITRELPKLTDAVVKADVKGEHTFDVSKTGAADAARTTGRKAAPVLETSKVCSPLTSAFTTASVSFVGQAAVAPGAQGAGRGPGRGRGQARRGRRGRSRHRALRLAQRRRDHEQAPEPLADRAGEGRRLRAQAREPDHRH